MEGEFGLRVVYVASSNLGYGETTANNEGPLLVAIGAPPGAPWCAYFAGYCYLRAAQLCEFDLPFRVSGNAKRLARNLAAAPQAIRFTDPSLARPGDLVVWHRGWNPLHGHAGIVVAHENGLVRTIEGNVGDFPSRVRELVHEVSRERLHCFAGLR